MAIQMAIPGGDKLHLEHLLLDQNGTLSDRGTLIEGVAERLRALATRVSVHVLSADTFGTLVEVAESLGVEGHRVATGEDKRAFAKRLGAEGCVAIGNGRNDVPMCEQAALAIAVIGPEGASMTALQAADVVCGSITDALDLLLDEQALVATLRP